MSKINSKQTPSTSHCDDQLKPKPTKKPSPCKHCGASHTLLNPNSPINNPVCQVCGRQSSDLPVFYYVCLKDNRMASPIFGSLVEASQFAAIFGITGHSDYALSEILYFFNPNATDRDAEQRKSVLSEIEFGRYVLNALRDPAVRKRYPGEQGFLKSCQLLGLDNYALPRFSGVAGSAS